MLLQRKMNKKIDKPANINIFITQKATVLGQQLRHRR